jgi:hypothetical protein
MQKIQNYKTTFGVDLYFQPKHSKFTGIFFQSAVERLEHVTESDELDIDVSNETSSRFALR